MRWILVGLMLLVGPSVAFGQATGEVQAIGFNGLYRPNCWTPMIVRLKAETPGPGTFQLQVFQHDLDGDRVIYTRKVTLNGNTTSSEQLFWMYFLPQPINRGLPDKSSGTLRDLQKDLQVFLYSEDGRRQVAELPVTSVVENVDPFRDGGNSPSRSVQSRGQKVVLAVTASGSKQVSVDLGWNQATGMAEDVEVVSVRTRELPDDPLGYEAVDAVLWLDGNPADLEAGNTHQFAALQDYVRTGGQLVVNQPTAGWQSTGGFGDMLPVDVRGVDSKADFEPLRSLAAVPNADEDGIYLSDVVRVYGSPTGRWERAAGPFTFARATARPGAVVEHWITWPAPTTAPAATGPAGTLLPPASQPATRPVDRTPYLARRAYGLGEVTWVAQDLATDSVPSNPVGWPYVWAAVFGWRNDAYSMPPARQADDPGVKTLVDRYRGGGAVDLGYTFVQGLNLDSKGAWLIVLAIVFFIAYWVVAGPGSYAYLLTTKRTGLSWFFFALSALLATAVTVGVVKLVLRGPPEARHVSFVRVAPGLPAVAYTRFGLYIPRDGDQSLVLGQAAPNSLTYLAPFPKHPQQLGDVTEFPGLQEYDVPVRDLGETDDARIDVPYRSSLKTFEARWVGTLPAQFAGTVRLNPDHGSLPLDGKLQNATGMDLEKVYLAFNVSPGKDWLVYVPKWPKGQTLDLQADLARARYPVGREGQAVRTPADGVVLSDELASPYAAKDPLRNGWSNYWFAKLRRGSLSDVNADAGEMAFPIVSLFDRLPPMPNVLGQGAFGGKPSMTDDRVDLLARGVRRVDASPSVAAGQLVVLVAAKGPLPVPITVDDRPIADTDGTTYYQFVLPIDRGGQ